MNTKTKATEPTITMSAFFALPVIQSAQAVQKRNPYGSPLHREAHETIRQIARRYGAENFIGGY